MNKICKIIKNPKEISNKFYFRYRLHLALPLAASYGEIPLAHEEKMTESINAITSTFLMIMILLKTLCEDL